MRVAAQQETRNLRKAGLVLRPDEHRPGHERRARRAAQVFEQHERFVVRRVAQRPGHERTAMQLVAVAARLDVMLDRDRRIVHESPACAAHRQAEREFPELLRPLPGETRVEPRRTKERRAVRAVRALEHVHVTRRSRAEMVVADRPAKPLHRSDDRAVAALERLPVAATRTAHAGIGEAGGEALNPVGPRLGVIVDERDDSG